MLLIMPSHEKSVRQCNLAHHRTAAEQMSKASKGPFTNGNGIDRATTSLSFSEIEVFKNQKLESRLENLEAHDELHREAEIG